MQVLLERVGDKYRASSLVPITSAEGNTREEALASFRDLLTAGLQNGAEVVELPLPSHGIVESENSKASIAVPQDEGKSSVMRFAGDMAGDPLYDEWVAAMRSYRQRVEEDPDIL